jgi:hypothetical protein
MARLGYQFFPMPFSTTVVENLLVACHRHCCVCHKPCGTKIEVHHIVQRAEGGDDSADNAIALCFDCHAEVAAYNPKHPKGRRFTAEELRRHRDQWIQVAGRPPWPVAPRLDTPPEPDDARSSTELLVEIRERDLVNPDVGPAVLRGMIDLDGQNRDHLRQEVSRTLVESPNQQARWNAAIAIEYYLRWWPGEVSDELLEVMSRDTAFGVRSSAAVCYAILAAGSPERVPIITLWRLAFGDGDWYTFTPATRALVILARSRSVAVDVLAAVAVEAEDAERRHRAAGALKEIAAAEPNALRWDVADLLQTSNDPLVNEVGRSWAALTEERRASGKSLDSLLF